MSELIEEKSKIVHIEDELKSNLDMSHMDLSHVGEPLDWKDIEVPPLLSKQMMPLLFSCFAVYFISTCNGFDGSLMSSIYTQDDYLRYFKLDAKSSTGTGLVFSIYNIAQVCAALFCPIMDWKGRKVTIILGAFGTVIGAIVTAVATNTGTLIAGRFIMSFFTTLANTAASTYVTEIACTKHRARTAGFYNCLWYVGSIIAALSAYGAERNYNGTNKSFKIPLWVQVICPGLVFIMAWFIPESPRWLVGAGKIDEARKMITKYHCNGDPNNKLVEFEIAEIISSFEGAQLANSLKILDLRPLLRKRSDRYRLMLVMVMAFYGQFSGNNVCSYYLPTMLNNIGMTSQTTNVLMNAVYSIVSWVSSLFGSYAHEIVGRRKMFMGSAIGASLCLTGLAIATARFDINATNSASNAALAFIYLFGITFSFAFTPMQPIYPAEVSSNVLRSRNLIILNLTAGVAQFINQFAAPEAMKNIGYWYYVFFALWDVTEFLVIYFFFVETKGKSLEELDVIFNANNPRKASLGDFSREDEKTIESLKQIFAESKAIGEV